MKTAAVDIGTNTVRLLLAEAVTRDDHVQLFDIERYEVITKLGEGLDASGRLGDEPMDRALRGLSSYADRIGAGHAVAVGGVATAATRSAANGADFIAQAADVLGFRPRVIDGVEEARLTFLGATAGLPRNEAYSVIDVGGGSTEFVVGRNLPDYAVSIDIGSVRLTERIESLGLTEPALVRDYVDQLFARVVLPMEPTVLLGSGGTFVTLAAVAAGVTTGEIGDTVILPFDELVATVDRLSSMTQTDIAELPAVPAARAGVLPAGAICAERAVAHVGADIVRVSVRDILDGLALELATQQWPGTEAPGHAR